MHAQLGVGVEKSKHIAMSDAHRDCTATAAGSLDELSRNGENLQTHSGRRHSLDSDNESTTSMSSEDSEMEPFSEYKSKIETLLSDIGLPNFDIEVLHHGYEFQNCVYAVTSPLDDNEKYVLRVPTCPRFRDGKCDAIENDASLLAYLQDKLPVPRVKAYSTIKSNALNAPYSVQTMIPGKRLDYVYEDLDHTEKLEVIDLYASLLVRIESVRFAKAGTFAASTTLPATIHDFEATAAPAVHIFNEGNEQVTKDLKTIRDRAGPDLKALLLSHIDGWIRSDANTDDGPYTLPGYKDLLAIMKDLEQEGAFNSGPHPVVLNHWDLEPRNIMVDHMEGAWKITGIIDWDDALALPRPLARRAPDWIWDFEPQEFTGFLNNDHHPNPKLTDEGIALKTYFDAQAAKVLEGYMEDAYGQGRWLRRIWTFARHGNGGNSWYLDLIKQMPEDWARRPKPVVIQPKKAKSPWKKSTEWLAHLVRILRP